MPESTVIFCEDFSDASDPEDLYSIDVETCVQKLADSATCKAALEALLAHRYAAEDVVRSRAWPAFCQCLPSVLSDADAEVAEAAATFSEQLYTEARSTCAQQLAELCMALAQHVATFCEGHTREKAVAEQLQQSCSTAGPAQTPGHGSSSDLAALHRGACRLKVASLLLRCLRVLSRLWASFKPDLMQRLWDCVSPVLKLSHGQCSSKPATAAACTSFSSGVALHSSSAVSESTSCQMQACGAASCRVTTAEHTADRQPLSESCQDRQTSDHGCTAWTTSSVNGQLRRKHFYGPLVYLCALPEWDSNWWSAWTAPAMSARWLPAALERHHVLPNLLAICHCIAASSACKERASAVEGFAVQVVGTVLSLSKGRSLFPLAVNSQACSSHAQVTVGDACIWLCSIGTRPARANFSAWSNGPLCPAVSAALEAMQLICRDDGPHSQVVTADAVYILCSAAASLRAVESNSSKEEVYRCTDVMMKYMSRTTYGQSILLLAGSRCQDRRSSSILADAQLYDAQSASLSQA